MRDRKLTGPWAGFSFKGGRLGWLACSTASRLNSALSFLRFDMDTPHGLELPHGAIE